MRTEAALYLVRNMLARYKDGPASRWHPKGAYVPQWLIPKAPRGVEAAIIKIMAGEHRHCFKHIRLDRLYSGQNSLTHRRLIRAVRYRPKMPPPDVFEYEGRFFVWNGNHRLTADILLGKTTVRARVSSVLPKRSRVDKPKSKR